MTGPRIGSTFSGYGGLDIAVRHVFGGTVAWHCQYEPPDKHGREDKNQYAARILARHWPDVPNHGDVTKVDWSQVEPVDILTGGFPCTDLSLAGLGAGIAPGTRSGLWIEMAKAIHALRPRLVVVENVPGILSREADRGLGPDAEGLDPATGAPLTLRALGAVLGDLADLGFDAEWTSVRASDVGACHKRNRVFVLAWPSDTEGPRLEGEWLRGRAAERRQVTADTDGFRRHGAGADQREPVGHAAVAGSYPADTACLRRGERQPEPAVRERCGDARGHGGPAAPDAGGGRFHGFPERDRGPHVDESAPLGDDVVGLGADWGTYTEAIEHHIRVFGRPAPWPTDHQGRLSARFVEWMMCLPEGHVTSLTDIPRPAQIKALGNGVVPQQAAHALRILLDRVAPA